MRTETINICKYSELSDDAKAVARDWYRGAASGDEFEYDDFVNVADILGISINDRNNKHYPKKAIFWSGFHNQGDGACYEATYRYKKGSAKAIREYAPCEETLHRIAHELQALQKRFFYSLTASTSHRGHYYHSGCMQVDVEDSREIDMPAIDTATEELTQILRDFADWIYSQLDKENDYRNSDEYVKEAIECNEYEFYENGKRAA